MANKESDSPPGLKKKTERFTCTMDIFTEISYGRDDEYLRAGGIRIPDYPGPRETEGKGCGPEPGRG